MTREKAEKLIQGVIYAQLCRSSGTYSLKSTLDDLDADSLDVASMVLMLEEELGYEIDYHDVDTKVTVESLIQWMIKNLEVDQSTPIQ